MSYAICNVVVGCELNSPLFEYINEAIDSELIDDLEDIGLRTFYTGSGQGPIYCGIRIHQFDECTRLLAKNLIPKLAPTPKQIADAKKLIAGVKNKLSDLMDKTDKELGEEIITFRKGKEKQKLLACIPDEPEVHLIWSSS